MSFLRYGFWGCLAGLLMRGSTGGAGAVLEEPQFVAPPKRLQLVYFSLKTAPHAKRLVGLLRRSRSWSRVEALPNRAFVVFSRSHCIRVRLGYNIV
jgi:hypothetical protein